MNTKQLQQGIKNLDNPTKKRLRGGYIDLSSSEEMQDAAFDAITKRIAGVSYKQEKIKFSEENKKKIDELVELLYKNMGWDTEEMNFGQANYQQKFDLLRSIYTLLQLRKPFPGKPYLECHACEGQITIKNESISKCKNCGLIVNYDKNIV